ncbi:MAG TPA: hypothetical protein VHW23_44085 [Kofleriaceae bacterium]|nr:hypothetical protein [Kofleriaceae bacterium]
MTMHGWGPWPLRLYRAVLALLVVFPIAVARAAPGLVVDEPSPRDPSGRYALQVQEDGTAALHLVWSDSDGKPHTADLSLSAFTTAGKPSIIVGFDAGAAGPPLPYRKGVSIPAEDAVLRLIASGLEPGVAYSGTLTAIVDRQLTTWELALVRPGMVPLFRCPEPAQTVRGDDAIGFELARTTPPRPLTVRLRVSPFVSQDGERGDGERGDIGFPPGPGETRLRDELTGVQVPGDRLVVGLTSRGLGEGMTYHGKLSISSGGGDALDCSLHIAMPRLPHAELVVDRQSFTATVSTPWFHTADATVSVRLFEKTRARPVYGITVALDGSVESPGGGFDFDRNMAFLLNGRPVPHLSQLPPEALHDPARSIAPGGQVEIQIAMHDLEVGKYALGLRFTAANAAAPTPRIELTVNVRHAWGYAMLAIIVALLVSFLLTRSIRGWRRRINLNRRVAQLRDQSFVEHSDLAIAVFLRVVLDQTQALLARNPLLPPPDSANDYITRAERVAAILTCYSNVIGRLRALRCPERIKRYYRELINDAIHRVGPAPLDQITTDAIIETLTAVDRALGEPFPSYWVNITGRGRVVAQQLHDVRQTLRATAPLDAMIAALGHPEQLTDAKPEDARVAAYDRLYWFARLLYSRREDQAQVEQLVGHCRPCQDHNDFPDVDLDGLFRDADRRAWERLKAEGPGRVRIQQGQPGQALEALYPLRFVLQFDDRALAGSYFVNNVLVYQWEFQFTPDRPAQGAAPVDSPVRVNQPRVTMYVPAAGKLTVRARIFWPAGGPAEPPIELQATEFAIGANQDLMLLNRLEASTVVYFGLMAAVAVATGLPTLYFDNPTFGSYADYVKILVWGIGIDQGKNLIQLIRSEPSDAPPPLPPPAPPPAP